MNKERTPEGRNGEFVEAGSLLAVDLGLKTGLALYGRDGNLRWYRSKNFGSAARLRRAVHSLLKEIRDLALLIVEGGGEIADIWEREAARRDIPARRVAAEQWRERLLLQRERRTGAMAKEAAVELADRVIARSGLRRPTAPRHDAAEAILVGLWAVLEARWLDRLPPEIRRPGISSPPP